MSEGLLRAFTSFTSPKNTDSLEAIRCESVAFLIDRAVARVLLFKVGFSHAEISCILASTGKGNPIQRVIAAASKACNEPGNDGKSAFYSALAGITRCSGHDFMAAVDTFVDPAYSDSELREHDLGLAYLRDFAGNVSKGKQDRPNCEHAPRRNGSGPLPEPEPLTAGTSSSPLAASHASGSSNGGHILD